MKIRLKKKAKVGGKEKPKGWTAEVQRSVALDLINDGKAEEATEPLPMVERIYPRPKTFTNKVTSEEDLDA